MTKRQISQKKVPLSNLVPRDFSQAREKALRMRLTPFRRSFPVYAITGITPTLSPGGSKVNAIHCKLNTGAHSFKLNGKFHLHVLFLSMGHSSRQC